VYSTTVQVVPQLVVDPASETQAKGAAASEIEERIKIAVILSRAISLTTVSKNRGTDQPLHHGPQRVKIGMLGPNPGECFCS
jgi:hypothetical protein